MVCLYNIVSTDDSQLFIISNCGIISNTIYSPRILVTLLHYKQWLWINFFSRIAKIAIICWPLTLKCTRATTEGNLAMCRHSLVEFQRNWIFKFNKIINVGTLSNYIFIRSYYLGYGNTFRRFQISEIQTWEWNFFFIKSIIRSEE